MAATTYTDQQNYNKYNLNGKSKDCGCGGKCDDCLHDHEDKKCGCCPVGLVGVYDDKGQFLSCMTPNDAELYKKNTAVCQDGYVMLINNTTGEKVGCVSEDNYIALTEELNGHGTTAPSGIEVVGNGVLGPESTSPMFARFTPVYTTDQGVTWSSSDASKVTVDSNGIITGVAAGAAVITATSTVNSSIHGSKTITVSDPAIAPLSINVVGGSSVDVDSTLALYAIYTPLNTTDQRTSWESSDNTKAMVDSNGLVTGIAEGHATITATSVADGTVQGTSVITVTHPS